VIAQLDRARQAPARLGPRFLFFAAWSSLLLVFAAGLAWVLTTLEQTLSVRSETAATVVGWALCAVAFVGISLGLAIYTQRRRLS
jgi:hypothetical protein